MISDGTNSENTNKSKNSLVTSHHRDDGKYFSEKRTSGAALNLPVSNGTAFVRIEFPTSVDWFRLN